jgi:hypothetical protein
MQADAAAAGVRFRNPPRNDAVNAPMPCITPAAQALVDTLRAWGLFHAVAVVPSGSELRRAFGSHRSAFSPALFWSERCAPGPARTS